MPIVRQPVLTETEEEKLKKKLSPLWKQGFTARTIANELEFGIENTPYEKLEMYHVYFYRRKFKLEPRRYKPEGVPRYKDKKEEIMPLDEFIETLNEKTHKLTFHDRRKRSYLIIHYWTPLRKSEIYERIIDDFETKKGKLIIHLLRKKKKYPKHITDEPLSVPLGFPLMNEVINWLKDREWEDSEENPENRPWNISHQTAWNYVKEVFKDYYPHFFRFNWITDAVDDTEVTLAELKSKTGLHISTLNTYIMASKRIQDRFDSRKLERMNIKSLPKSSMDLNPLKRERGRPRKRKRRKPKKKGPKKSKIKTQHKVEKTTKTKTTEDDELAEFEKQMEEEGLL